MHLVGVSTARMVFGSIFLVLIDIPSPQPSMTALKASICFFFRVNTILHYPFKIIMTTYDQAVAWYNCCVFDNSHLL